MTSQPFNPDAWLGPAAEDTSDEQKQRLTEAADTINARWPDPDLADTRENALNGAAQVILGDDTLEGTAAAWKAAHARAEELREILTGAIIATKQAGRPETELAIRAGVARDTIRKALGKR